MFYTGEVPWHKLGTKLDRPATAEEAIAAAGLDYTVRMKPLQTVINRKRVAIDGHFATVRQDTGAILGVVGSRYEILQNKDAFAFFDGITGAGEAMYHTAGALGKGERIWILAKLPGYIKVGKEDIIDKYLLLTNSHDGSSLVRAKLTPIRVVCNNTLSVALSGTEQEVRIRHTPNALARLDEAHKLLGLTNQLYDQLHMIFNRMASKPMREKQLVEFVKTLVPENPDAEYQTRNQNIRDAILELHENGLGADMNKGNVFGAYNAVTEYVDHVQHSKDPAKHLKSLWFGGGERMKRAAFELAKTISMN